MGGKGYGDYKTQQTSSGIFLPHLSFFNFLPFPFSLQDILWNSILRSKALSLWNVGGFCLAERIHLAEQIHLWRT